MSTQATNLDITGMHCSSCALLIQKQVQKNTGVKEVNVNFASQKAHIVYDPDQTKLEDLISVITKAGYHAAPLKEGDTNREKIKRQQEVKFSLTKFLLGLMLSSPMLLFMAYDFTSRLPFENLIMPWSGVISLLLTTPVLFYIGANFFAGFWSALKLKTFSMDSLIAIGTGTAFIYSLYEFIKYFIQTGSLIGLNGSKIPNLYFEVSDHLCCSRKMA